ARPGVRHPDRGNRPLHPLGPQRGSYPAHALRGRQRGEKALAHPPPAGRRGTGFAGVSPGGVAVAVYVISGVAAALAGIVLAGYVGQSYLGMGDPYLFSSVAAVAIGGASILGGSGDYVGT